MASAPGGAHPHPAPDGWAVDVPMREKIAEPEAWERGRGWGPSPAVPNAKRSPRVRRGSCPRTELRGFDGPEPPFDRAYGWRRGGIGVGPGPPVAFLRPVPTRQRACSAAGTPRAASARHGVPERRQAVVAGVADPPTPRTLGFASRCRRTPCRTAPAATFRRRSTHGRRRRTRSGRPNEHDGWSSVPLVPATAGPPVPAVRAPPLDRRWRAPARTRARLTAFGGRDTSADAAPGPPWDRFRLGRHSPPGATGRRDPVGTAPPKRRPTGAARSDRVVGDDDPRQDGTDAGTGARGAAWEPRVPVPANGPTIQRSADARGARRRTADTNKERTR